MGESDALGSQIIKPGCFDNTISIAAGIAGALVIGYIEDYIGMVVEYAPITQSWIFHIP